MRLWEFHFPIPPWLLEVFGIMPGVFLEIEVFICRDDPDRKENSFIATLWLNRVVDIKEPDQPHRAESVTFNFSFSWPNPYHISDEEYCQNLAPSEVSEGSNDTFVNTDWMPDSPAPDYRNLSPQPPCFQAAEGEQQPQQPEISTLEIIQRVNERIGQACTIAEGLAQTIYRVRAGRDLDQVAFREGRLTYCQLQQIDRANNPDLNNNAADTAIAGPSAQLQEDEEHHKGEEEEWPPSHCLRTLEQTQVEDLSLATQMSPEFSENSTRQFEPIKTPIIPFPQEEDWSLWLNKQLDRVFQ